MKRMADQGFDAEGHPTWDAREGKRAVGFGFIPMPWDRLIHRLARRKVNRVRDNLGWMRDEAKTVASGAPAEDATEPSAHHVVGDIPGGFNVLREHLIDYGGSLHPESASLHLEISDRQGAGSDFYRRMREETLKARSRELNVAGLEHEVAQLNPGQQRDLVDAVQVKEDRLMLNIAALDRLPERLVEVLVGWVAQPVLRDALAAVIQRAMSNRG